MSKINIVILFTLLIGQNCFAAAHKHTKKNKTGINSVMMQRTGCYGRCEQYSIEITEDGYAIYTGIRFTKDSGVFQKKIGVDIAKTILDEVKTFRLDTCKDKYPNRIPDLPGIIYTIKYKKTTQRILNANFGPYFLTDIAVHIDDIGKKNDDKGWERH